MMCGRYDFHVISVVITRVPDALLRRLYSRTIIRKNGAFRD
jgi:hypothetical protein